MNIGPLARRSRSSPFGKRGLQPDAIYLAGVILESPQMVDMCCGIAHFGNGPMTLYIAFAPESLFARYPNTTFGCSRAERMFLFDDLRSE